MFPLIARGHMNCRVVGSGYFLKYGYSTDTPQVNNMLSFGNLLWWSSYRSTYLLYFINIKISIYMGKLVV